MISEAVIANLHLNHGSSQPSVDQELQIALQEAYTAINKHREGQQALFRKNKARELLLDIKSGKRSFAQESLKIKAINSAEANIKQASNTLVNLGTIQYHRPMVLIYKYCLKCKECLSTESNQHCFNNVLAASLHNLEILLDNLQGSRNSAKGSPSLRKSLTASHEHIIQIEFHLKERLENMNFNRTREVEQVLTIPVVQNALVKARELPTDSFILFFEKGMLLQKKGHDERFHTQTFDVDRLCNNDGRLDRLIGHEPDGYVVIRAMHDTNGEPMISKTAGRVLKEVIDLNGSVPENIVRGMDFGLLLRKYKQRIDTTSSALNENTNHPMINLGNTFDMNLTLENNY